MYTMLYIHANDEVLDHTHRKTTLYKIFFKETDKSSIKILTKYILKCEKTAIGCHSEIILKSTEPYLYVCQNLIECLINQGIHVCAKLLENSTTLFFLE